jgi:CTP-dependent riboflavin kinase
LRGRVVAGRGDFARWITLLSDLYLAKTGLRLFPGTLNLQLDHVYDLPATRLRLEGTDYGGTVSVNLVPCRIFGRAAFILRTDANETDQGDHPRSLIEIAAEVKLRDVHHLSDGDLVEVEVDPVGSSAH